jgi:hypothetical protein
MKSITMAFLSAALSTPSFPAARTEAAQRPGFTLSGRSEWAGVVHVDSDQVGDHSHGKVRGELGYPVEFVPLQQSAG